jgi:hypothetical protein
VLLAALVLLIVRSPGPVEGLRYVVFDGYQRLFPLDRESHPVTIVVIDEASLARHGQWPWPRTRIAELIERIDAARPAAIGVDLFFPEPDRFSPEGDRRRAAGDAGRTSSSGCASSRATTRGSPARSPASVSCSRSPAASPIRASRIRRR